MGDFVSEIPPQKGHRGGVWRSVSRAVGALGRHRPPPLQTKTTPPQNTIILEFWSHRLMWYDSTAHLADLGGVGDVLAWLNLTGTRRRRDCLYGHTSQSVTLSDSPIADLDRDPAVACDPPTSGAKTGSRKPNHLGYKQTLGIILL